MMCAPAPKRRTGRGQHDDRNDGSNRLRELWRCALSHRLHHWSVIAARAEVAGITSTDAVVAAATRLMALDAVCGLDEPPNRILSQLLAANRCGDHKRGNDSERRTVEGRTQAGTEWQSRGDECDNRGTDRNMESLTFPAAKAQRPSRKQRLPRVLRRWDSRGVESQDRQTGSPTPQSRSGAPSRSPTKTGDEPGHLLCPSRQKRLALSYRCRGPSDDQQCRTQRRAHRRQNQRNARSPRPTCPPDRSPPGQLHARDARPRPVFFHALSGGRSILRSDHQIRLLQRLIERDVIEDNVEKREHSFARGTQRALHRVRPKPPPGIEGDPRTARSTILNVSFCANSGTVRCPLHDLHVPLLTRPSEGRRFAQPLGPHNTFVMLQTA